MTDKWQPIETAPIDGSTVLVLMDGDHFIAGFDGENWIEENTREKLLFDLVWMPLPTPPSDGPMVLEPEPPNPWKEAMHEAAIVSCMPGPWPTEPMEFLAKLVTFEKAQQATKPSTPAGEGWVEWRGGECPVHQDAEVSVRLRSHTSKTEEVGRAGNFRWSDEQGDFDIIAYKLAGGAA